MHCGLSRSGLCSVLTDTASKLAKYMSAMRRRTPRTLNSSYMICSKCSANSGENYIVPFRGVRARNACGWARLTSDESTGNSVCPSTEDAPQQFQHRCGRMSIRSGRGNVKSQRTQPLSLLGRVRWPNICSCASALAGFTITASETMPPQCPGARGLSKEAAKAFELLRATVSSEMDAASLAIKETLLSFVADTWKWKPTFVRSSWRHVLTSPTVRARFGPAGADSWAQSA